MSGVSQAEYYATKGIVASGRVPVNGRGVPAPEVMSTTPYKPLNCEGVTKSGVACTARPVKHNHLCAGHIKQAEAQNATE